MMKLAEGIDGSSFVTAAGGNGHEIGIQVSGLPGQWFTVAASTPKGKFDVDLPEDRSLGAIGDSAVVEASTTALSPIAPKERSSGRSTSNLPFGVLAATVNH